MIWYAADEEPEYGSSDNYKHLRRIIGVEDTIKLYEHFGTANSIIRADELHYRAAGISEVAIERLVAAKSLQLEPEETFKNAIDVYLKMKFLQQEQREHFYCLALGLKLNLIQTILIGIGSNKGVVVDIKEMFRLLLQVPRVNSFIVVHNHPSGNSKPSGMDIELTHKIQHAGHSLSLQLNDHIIIGHENYTSLAEEGQLLNLR